MLGQPVDQHLKAVFRLCHCYLEDCVYDHGANMLQNVKISRRSTTAKSVAGYMKTYQCFLRTTVMNQLKRKG